MRKTESALLGRSNVATTFNLYVRSNLNQEKKRVERMGKFLGMAELNCSSAYQFCLWRLDGKCQNTSHSAAPTAWLLPAVSVMTKRI